MTRVEFFFNVQDKHQKLLTISEKVIARGLKLMVYVADANEVAVTRDYLWRQPHHFLPNQMLADDLAPVTPILVDYQREPLIHDEVLINLQHPHPPFFSRFKRLIEIVGLDEADKAQARIRYQFYRDRGYQITSVDDRS
jgi:DNA polymerase-3 subunit chi